MRDASISRHFENEHDRLDELFKNFQKYRALDYPRAREFYAQFRFGLQRHMTWEEEILFPIFEGKTGLTSGGPTQVMRLEHKNIDQFVESIYQGVKAGKDPIEEETMLLSVLALHHQKEENLVFPAIDKTLDSKEAESVFEAMRSLPDERYRRICRSA